MKLLCTILLSAALFLGTLQSASAQSIEPGTYVYSGLASNAQTYTITAVVSETGISFQEAMLTDVLCTATLQVESIDPTGQIFTYKTTTPGTGDCTLGMPFVFSLTPAAAVITFRKADGFTYTLNLQ